VASSVVASGVQGKQVSTIPPPVDDDRFKPTSDAGEMRERLGIGHDEVVYLFVGSYKKSKGLDALVESFGEVLHRIPRARLIYTTEHESDASKDGKRRVKSLIGELSQQKKVLHLKGVSDMENLMAAADVLVMPFLDTDGPSDYPIAIIEAMAVGRPVIAAAVGGIPEIVMHEENGILVNRGSVEDLTRAMIELGQDRKKRLRLGDYAVKTSERFSLNRIALETLEVYENAFR
jgi:glycosyltransferase involved in cell wall biosynthesis